MRTARRYIAREIYRSTAVVLVALVGLFLFFALIEGLDKVGQRLTLLNLFYLQALDVPNHLYELLPIGLLIGAVLALAGLAQRNELTILRASGVSGLRLLGALWLITIPLVLGAFILSEFITPAAELRGSESRLALLGRTDGGRLSSGYWFKEADSQGGTRIINIAQLSGQGRVSDVVLYEFAADDTLLDVVHAAKGQFEQGRLVLRDLTETRIRPQSANALANAQVPDAPISELVHLDERSISTTLTPERLIARILTPERMAISDLLDYIHYLKNNQLQADRQEVALWRKIAYPFTLLVMITIAAPIGFMQTRRGGVGVKVFAGIILGVGFFMLNQLALNAGMLGDWPPWATALVPSMVGLAAALLALLGMEHRHPLALWLRQRRIQRSPA
ncbi:MAG: LPS export ABC transporter permease LptG [Castellaniella sp.]|uniref:LPS export ABC transporter permease LptG n=1 Tax=Castellaniella sp. TaxID=1955812 RepID=UPI002A362DB3|nr:LPS export ABC transporter permease LptG [Castellaniella sp.]MDY0309378.1 LPS export ABC transporter permease LptG [Castellaniella sp.]